MKLAISVLILLFKGNGIQGRPLHDRFTFKFNPLSLKDDLRPKDVGGMFAKIPQEFTDVANKRRDSIAKLNPQRLINGAGIGCTNQIARIMFPLKNLYRDFNDSQTWDAAQFINLPLIQQPFKDYKIIVATAPPHIKLLGEDGDKPLVVYVVFSEHSTADAESGYLNMPAVYFVNTPKDFNLNIDKSHRVDPILVLDNNRTVTGLKSRNVAKYIKFKSKNNRNKKYLL